MNPRENDKISQNIEKFSEKCTQQIQCLNADLYKVESIEAIFQTPSFLESAKDYLKKKGYKFYPSEKFSSDRVYSIRTNFEGGCVIYGTLWLGRYHGIKGLNNEKEIAARAKALLNGGVYLENIPAVFEEHNWDAQLVNDINTFKDIKKRLHDHGPFYLRMSLEREDGLGDHITVAVEAFEEEGRKYLVIADMNHKGGTEKVAYDEIR